MNLCTIDKQQASHRLKTGLLRPQPPNQKQLPVHPASHPPIHPQNQNGLSTPLVPNSHQKYTHSHTHKRRASPPTKCFPSKPPPKLALYTSNTRTLSRPDSARPPSPYQNLIPPNLILNQNNKQSAPVNVNRLGAADKHNNTEL